MAKTQAVWKERVARWREGGKSLEEFAEREGLKLASLKWWRWRLEGARGKATGPVAHGTTFLEVEPAAAERSPVPAADGQRYEVVLGNGRVVRVPVGFADSEFARVLSVAGAGRR